MHYIRASHPFGNLLSTLRARKHGLSQAKLAEMAGYDPAVITRMAQGQKDLTGTQARERVLRVIRALHEAEVLNGLDEANALLAAAGMPPLFAGDEVEVTLLNQLELHCYDGDAGVFGITQIKRSALKITTASVFVDDQDKALRFYTEKLGFVKKEDLQDGEWRVVSVVPKDNPNSIPLEFLPATFPSARALQREMFDAEFAIFGFQVEDVQAEYNRLTQAGVVFIDEPVFSEEGQVTFAKFDDTCGNLINLIQPKK
jgi:catechol 2,3-dioxygenase-like lactoylglutathione lyase family enzyme